MENIINLIVNNGIAVVVVAYFLYSNYKWNEKLVDTLARIDETMSRMSTKIDKGVCKYDNK